MMEKALLKKKGILKIPLRHSCEFSFFEHIVHSIRMKLCASTLLLLAAGGTARASLAHSYFSGDYDLEYDYQSEPYEPTYEYHQRPPYYDGHRHGVQQESRTRYFGDHPHLFGDKAHAVAPQAVKAQAAGAEANNFTLSGQYAILGQIMSVSEDGRSAVVDVQCNLKGSPSLAVASGGSNAAPAPPASSSSPSPRTSQPPTQPSQGTAQPSQGPTGTGTPGAPPGGRQAPQGPPPSPQNGPPPGGPGQRPGQPPGPGQAPQGPPPSPQNGPPQGGPGQRPGQPTPNGPPRLPQDGPQGGPPPRFPPNEPAGQRPGGPPFGPSTGFNPNDGNEPEPGGPPFGRRPTRPPPQDQEPPIFQGSNFEDPGFDFADEFTDFIPSDIDFNRPPTDRGVRRPFLHKRQAPSTPAPGTITVTGFSAAGQGEQNSTCASVATLGTMQIFILSTGGQGSYQLHTPCGVFPASTERLQMISNAMGANRNEVVGPQCGVLPQPAAAGASTSRAALSVLNASGASGMRARLDGVVLALVAVVVGVLVA